MTAPRFSFADHSFLAATAVWTLGWLGSGVLAVEHVTHVIAVDAAEVVAVVLSAVLATFGLRVTWKVATAARRPPGAEPPRPPPDPWPRRIVGWFAGLVWCGGAVAWNVGIIGLLLKSAHEGRGTTMLVLIPWSLIGWFLLMVLFAGVGVLLDDLWRLARRL